MSQTIPRIHPTAIVSPEAKLHPTVQLGPYVVIGPNVEMGEGCVVMAHAVVDGRTRMGARNTIFPHAVLGMVPQDLKYAGEPTRLEIGDDNIFREAVTCHVGTGDAGVTRIGSGCLLMGGMHLAHDCVVGDKVIVANNTGIAGHCRIDDYAIVGGVTGIHQYVHIGRHAMVGGHTRVASDVPPYCIAEGSPGTVVSLNRVGVKRAGFDDIFRKRLQRAFRILYRSRIPFGKVSAALVAELGDAPPVDELVTFIKETKRGLTKGLSSSRGDDGDA